MLLGMERMDGLAEDIARQGYAVRRLLQPATCEAIIALYEAEENFRSRVVMARHGFGRGEYKYFKYPLPEPVARLRAALYPPLARLANEWAMALGQEQRFPASLSEYTAQCHAAGQSRPTPLLLR